jgi:hypothetical protein
MMQMGDSASDTTLIEGEASCYKLSSQGMRKMVHSLEVMESRLDDLWVTMGRAQIDPVLTELGAVKTCISKVEPKVKIL